MLVLALAAVFTVTGAPVPRQEVKYYIGAGLAVLGVNLVGDTGSSASQTSSMYQFSSIHAVIPVFVVTYQTARAPCLLQCTCQSTEELG